MLPSVKSIASNVGKLPVVGGLLSNIQTTVFLQFDVGPTSIPLPIPGRCYVNVTKGINIDSSVSTSNGANRRSSGIITTSKGGPLYYGEGVRPRNMKAALIQIEVQLEKYEHRLQWDGLMALLFRVGDWTKSRIIVHPKTFSMKITKAYLETVDDSHYTPAEGGSIYLTLIEDTGYQFDEQAAASTNAFIPVGGVPAFPG